MASCRTVLLPALLTLLPVISRAQTPAPAAPPRSSILNIALNAFGGNRLPDGAGAPAAPSAAQPDAGASSRTARNTYRGIALLLAGNLQKKPADSSMKQDFHQFFGRLKTAAYWLNDPIFAPGSELPAKVDTAEQVAQFNQFLVENSRAVLMAVVPFEIPKGMDVRDVTLLISAKDPNAARIECTVALAKDVDFSVPLDWMGMVPLFRKVTEQARFVVGIREKYGKIPVWGRLRLLIRKTDTGLEATLQRVHAVAGTTDDAPDQPRHGFQVEVPEAELKTAYQRALEAPEVKLVDRRFDIPGADGHATITRLEPSFGWDERARLGSIDVDAAGSGHLGVAGGIDFAVKDLKLRMQIYRRAASGGRTPEGNRWYVYGNASATLDVSDRALGLISGFGARAATESFGALGGKVHQMVGDLMSKLGISYVSGMGVENVRIATKTLTFRTTEATLDLDALTATYFGRDGPVLVDEISLKDGKLTLGGAPKK